MYQERPIILQLNEASGTMDNPELADWRSWWRLTGGISASYYDSVLGIALLCDN